MRGRGSEILVVAMTPDSLGYHPETVYGLGGSENARSNTEAHR
jgi:hypothetical protein